jgi:hypothetical protein
MRRTTEDVDGTADTERPAAYGVWRCDGEGAEPSQFATLLESTGEPPRTPEAEVYGGGAMLAVSADDVDAIERDSDTVLSVVLADDFARAASS